MRYVISSHMAGTLHFLSLPEAADVKESPYAAQAPEGDRLLERLDSLLFKAQQRASTIASRFHEDSAERVAFEDGEVYVSRGSPLLVVTLQRGFVCAFAGPAVLFRDTKDLLRLRRAVLDAMRAQPQGGPRFPIGPNLG